MTEQMTRAKAEAMLARLERGEFTPDAARAEGIDYDEYIKWQVWAESHGLPEDREVVRLTLKACMKHAKHVRGKVPR